MSLIARTAARQTVALRQSIGRRSIHIDNVIGNNTPFSYQNKTAFAVKITLFFVTGFSLPFVTSFYQVAKSKGA